MKTIRIFGYILLYLLLEEQRQYRQDNVIYNKHEGRILDIKEIDQEQKKLLEEIVTLVITEWK